MFLNDTITWRFVPLPPHLDTASNLSNTNQSQSRPQQQHIVTGTPAVIAIGRPAVTATGRPVHPATPNRSTHTTSEMPSSRLTPQPTAPPLSCLNLVMHTESELPTHFSSELKMAIHKLPNQLREPSGEFIKLLKELDSKLKHDASTQLDLQRCIKTCMQFNLLENNLVFHCIAELVRCILNSFHQTKIDESHYKRIRWSFEELVELSEGVNHCACNYNYCEYKAYKEKTGGIAYKQYLSKHSLSTPQASANSIWSLALREQLAFLEQSYIGSINTPRWNELNRSRFTSIESQEEHLLCNTSFFRKKKRSFFLFFLLNNPHQTTNDCETEGLCGVGYPTTC